MDHVISPRPLAGTIRAIPSKSQAHRSLICAAFADYPTVLHCPQTNRDIEATAACLRALGAGITRTETGYRVEPACRIPASAALPCGESGSTLRFFLPIVGALGVEATFLMEGRLPQRPLSPLWEELERMGLALSRPTENSIHSVGRLRPGDYIIDGGVSSQFITGLLFAQSLMEGESSLTLTGRVESAPYIDMTVNALAQFGARPQTTQTGFRVTPRQLCSPGTLEVEGDWSNAAFFLAARALGSEVTVTGLNQESPQGDRAAAHWLEKLKQGRPVIDATHIPDLVPILAVVAGACHGAEFLHCGRLRLKETDRLETTAALVNNLGGRAEIRGDSLTVVPTGYAGGWVDATGDHRIAMAAAIAATVCAGPVTVHNAQEVGKSYPGFWDDYRTLGGSYEQYLR